MFYHHSSKNSDFPLYIKKEMSEVFDMNEKIQNIRHNNNPNQFLTLDRYLLFKVTIMIYHYTSKNYIFPLYIKKKLSKIFDMNEKIQYRRHNNKPNQFLTWDRYLLFQVTIKFYHHTSKNSDFPLYIKKKTSEIFHMNESMQYRRHKNKPNQFLTWDRYLLF